VTIFDSTATHALLAKRQYPSALHALCGELRFRLGKELSVYDERKGFAFIVQGQQYEKEREDEDLDWKSWMQQLQPIEHVIVDCVKKPIMKMICRSKLMMHQAVRDCLLEDDDEDTWKEECALEDTVEIWTELQRELKTWSSDDLPGEEDAEEDAVTEDAATAEDEKEKKEDTVEVVETPEKKKETEEKKKEDKKKGTQKKKWIPAASRFVFHRTHKKSQL
jgi:hypothetical protein